MSILNTMVLAIFFCIFFSIFGLSQKNDTDFLEVFGKIEKNNNWVKIDECKLVFSKEVPINSPSAFTELLAYQIKEAYQQRFKPESDTVIHNLTIFEAASQIFAFGIYSLQKSPSLDFWDIGFEAYSISQKLVCWYGNYIVSVETADTLRDNLKYMREIADDAVKCLPKQKRKTPILESLPEKDKVKHSEKYYLKRWLGQEYFHNIYYADYYIPQGYSRIFIINNRSTAAADSNFWNYFNYISVNSDTLSNRLNLSTDYYIVDEPLWGKTLLAKKNQIIYGILDYRDPKWTVDRLEEVLNRLKKSKIVKPG